MPDAEQLDLLRQRVFSLSLPRDYEPFRPAHFQPSYIYLSKGSMATLERRQFVERICDLYPEARVEERLDAAHNQLELGERSPLNLHRAGKHTLVFGELTSAVRFAQEKGNACPNYWHFSPYGFCPYGCRYCYLAGTPGVKFSPSVKIYVNLAEILHQIDTIARRLATPTLNSERDEIYILYSVENGWLGHVPGYSIFFDARFEYGSESKLKAGQTLRLPVTLETKKDGRGDFSGSFVYVGEEYSLLPLPWPEGLDAYFEPPEFTAYPNTTYNFDLVISTAPELDAGTYYLHFYHIFETSSYGSGWIKLTVE